MAKSNIIVRPCVIAIRASMNLKAIHGMNHVKVWTAKHTCDSAHNSPTGCDFFNPCGWMTSPNWVLDHDNSHEDYGYGKANKIGDLGGF
jgi:hypothetical protein